MPVFDSRRRFLAGLGATTYGIFLASCAQTLRARRTPRVGYLTGAGFPMFVAAFRSELRKLGYVEGKNVILELRESRPNSSDGEVHAAELAASDLDLIVVAALAIAIEVRRHNPAMRLVIATGPNLVGNGFAKSLEHPGGNATGLDELPPGLTGRRLSLLKSAAPDISRVALLSTTPGVGAHEIQVADAKAAAQTLGISVVTYRATSLPELRTALDRMRQDGINGLVNFQGGLSLVHRDLIIDFTRERRIPAIYQSKLFPTSGGLMALSPDQEDQFREAARYVDKILRGANPGDLPIRHPGRYYLTVNLEAARDIGLALPGDLLGKADFILS